MKTKAKKKKKKGINKYYVKESKEKEEKGNVVR